jgi:myosin heavy subunit
MADDLASLDSIDADAVMATLQQRYDANKIYTRNGSVLVAINPYKDVQLYTDGHLKDYQSALALDKMPPHVFAVAAAAHRSMISANRSQAVVISGESGAGKTESARFVLQYLRFVSNATEDLEKRIHASSPLTEAFGCAKTLRNDNSSRFGKFLMLHFDQSAKIRGASLSTYLLEKSRISHISPGARRRRAAP